MNYDWMEEAECLDADPEAWFPASEKQMNRKAKVKKEPEGWTVTQLQSRAVAGSWDTAITFATQIAT
jgi:hypothetical protein